MEERNTINRRSYRISDVVFERVLEYIHDSYDRQSISLVCRRLYELESRSRKHVSISLCYTTTPKQLRRRFPFLESVKLKGRPRIESAGSALPENWGGFATPWVEALSMCFRCLKDVHLRRMVVNDEDLELLGRERGDVLQVLKLDICSGFSTDGLAHISTHCRKLKVLFLEGSSVEEKDGDWLHELAMNNTQLETLNFYLTKLSLVSSNDLELIAERCKSLTSVKISSNCQNLDLDEFFYLAASLEEFYGDGFYKFVELYPPQPCPEFDPPFPPGLCRLGPNRIDTCEMYLLGLLASRLKKLDLLYASLDTDDLCILLSDCHNLEVLETGVELGDRGMEVVARSCKKLKEIGIQQRPDGEWWEYQDPDEVDEDEEQERVVTPRGLTAIAQGCLDLEYICVYVSNITNAALESMGKNLKKLRDFRMALCATEEVNTDFPLDSGIRSLLSGCKNLRRLSLSLGPGALTDMGMTYIGQYGQNLRYVLLHDAGESDTGLLGFSRGCPSLRKLKLCGCCFSEKAIAMAVLQLRSLRYLWVEEYMGYKTGLDLLAMTRPFWNIEIVPPSKVLVLGKPVFPAHILAYYSLSGPRTDYPYYVSVDQFV